ncbi:DUF4752 family protein [Enterobacter chengduensis]|uniref:DUF4752 family protein n=1 Tax=Enterobacter chengduensis TaxID=2494701 RepID=UPI001BDF3202|nr:DUF4752 family protein [Enterobacter chengduensis]MBT1934529.1 DUF4752 family protein [Enterobacter chengduensis]MBT1962878.1 DUF4752 family protein [Enterobacter chengduensis]
MDAFAKYTIIDWIVLFQVMLIWFFMAYKAGQWIFGIALRKVWRWWNRKDEKLLALDSFYEAFNLGDIQPGNAMVVTTESGMTIRIHKPKGPDNG